MNPSFLVSKTVLGTVTAIVITGALLNLANKGTFGTAVQDLSKYVTTGYGAGAL